MAERRVLLPEPELERALLDLGRHVVYPPTPDLATSVRRHLAAHPDRPRSFWRSLLPLQRRLVLALLALVVLAGVSLAISPELRTAVADRLGLRGVQLEQVPAVPTPPPATTPQPAVLTPVAGTTPPAVLTPVSATAQAPAPGSIASPVGPTLATGRRLNLGEPMTLEQVRARVAYQVEVPTALGAPDEVYLLAAPLGGQVALVYYPRSDLPEAKTTGVGLLFTQFRGNVHSTGALGKGLPPGTRLEEVQVSGGRGYWIEGDPHVFFYVDAQGQRQTETTRLAGNVLLWEHGELTLRIESALPKDTAMNIAASTR